MNDRFVVFFAGVANEILIPADNIKGLLINAATAGKSIQDIRRVRKIIQKLNPEHLMLDSGGFQILKNSQKGARLSYDPTRPLEFTPDKINIAPTHVVEMARTFNPDLMVALDNPIGKITDPLDQDQEFLSKLGYNAAWAHEISSCRRDANLDEIKLLLPVQCYNLRQFEVFQKLICGCAHDGVCMPIRNMGLKDILLFMRAFLNSGYQHIHLLGTTTLEMVAISAYLARHYFDWVSLDSQTWVICAKNQQMLNPFDIMVERIHTDMIIDHKRELKCGCPWCGYEDFSSIKNKEYTEKLIFLCKHNSWVTQDIASRAYEHSDTLEGLNSFLSSRSRNEKKVKRLITYLKLFEIYMGKSMSEFISAMNTIAK